MMAAQVTNSAHTLQSLLQGIISVPEAANVPLTGISNDSRKVQPGDAFVAYEVPGQSNMRYVDDALRAGAAAVIAEAALLPEDVICPVPVVRIEKLHEYVGVLADHFYNHPSADMTVVGITGTNGKTSVSHLLARSLSELTGIKTGLIGTLGCGLLPELQAGKNTTPDAISLQRMLADMRSAGAGQVVLEVSSHGIDQQRIAGVDFAMAILTNVSRDHLDYHSSMENYVATKRRLFTDYGISRAVVNLDDALGRDLADSLAGNMQICGYTLGQQQDGNAGVSCMRGEILQQRLAYMKIRISSPWGEGVLESRLFGQHNASNLLACLSALCMLGMPLEKSISALAQSANIPGRLEAFSLKNSATFIVDYAHTPDALQHVLQTLKPLCRGKLHCVFGCGGERDRGKRAEMGRIAGRMADVITLTNDNPRREAPDAIIADIIEGIGTHDHVNVITDRRQAIAAAASHAGVDDIVLVAGKGHEQYQDINGCKYPFSDQHVIRELLEKSA